MDAQLERLVEFAELPNTLVQVVPMLTACHQLQGEALSQAASVAMINQFRKGTP